ncbi:MauE/DoxX family redox-associated membrane protein [Flavobacterium sp.]|uniref:MauE/DoxX family redox-associated membrane protein n=1 Tax=Flavobacterium sp. TaxID=239 RepID=UPI0031D1DDA6
MESDCSKNVLVIEITRLLYVLLFIYAASSKLMEFESFEIQLGKSPLLSAFAFWIARLIPFAELLIAVLLLFSKSMKAGLYLALNLMIMFSAYIFIILHYSSFVPCSCGGILEKMSWNAHLFFNIIFIVLALASIIILEHKSYKKSRKTISKILFPALASITAVIILFLLSEQVMHYDNPFIRRYPNHPAVFKNAQDLKYNSYYFAGDLNNKLYLGNYSTPLDVTQFDAELKSSQKIKVTFNTKNIPFRTVKIFLQDSVFYLSDGSVGRLFSGNTNEWIINFEYKDMPFFTLYVPMAEDKIFFRSNDPKTLDNILGVYTLSESKRAKYCGDLLQKQIDGVFDTDGTLLYSTKLKRSIYVYYYRNEYFTTDQTGKLEYRSHTIDTISKADFKVAYSKNGTVREISSPVEAVNAHASVIGKLLFVHSQVKGKYENDVLWKKSFIIDVYDLKRKVYLMSFPIYKTKADKLNAMYVSSNYFYALIGTDLVVYELQPMLKKQL